MIELGDRFGVAGLSTRLPTQKHFGPTPRAGLSKSETRPAASTRFEGQYMGLLKFTPHGWENVETLLTTLDPQTRDRLDMTGLLRRLLRKTYRSKRLAQTVNGARLTIRAIWLFTNAWRRTANCCLKIRVLQGSNLTQSSMMHGEFYGSSGRLRALSPGLCTERGNRDPRSRRPSAIEIDAADVGAGTGIWTMMLAACGLRSITAVEPDDEMRRQGILASQGKNISWRKGTGEATGLANESFHLVTMASSFHWVDFDKGCAEFQRILRPGGRFVALWNPRLIEINPLLVEIEREITRLKPDIRRVSSGRSGLTDRLPICFLRKLVSTTSAMSKDGTSRIRRPSIIWVLGVR